MAPPALAEADVPENSEAISSMDAEDSHVSSGPPSVPVVEVTPAHRAFPSWLPWRVWIVIMNQ